MVRNGALIIGTIKMYNPAELNNLAIQELLDDKAFCEKMGYDYKDVCAEYVERNTDSRPRYASGQLKLT